jgi:hypothetical protein
MTMHHPTRPDCWAETATECCDWAWDRGRSCAQHATPALSAAIARHANCEGCARGQRARDISARIVVADKPERRGTVGRGPLVSGFGRCRISQTPRQTE